MGSDQVRYQVWRYNGIPKELRAIQGHSKLIPHVNLSHHFPVKPIHSRVLYHITKGNLVQPILRFGLIPGGQFADRKDFFSILNAISEPMPTVIPGHPSWIFDDVRQIAYQFKGDFREYSHMVLIDTADAIDMGCFFYQTESTAVLSRQRVQPECIMQIQNLWTDQAVYTRTAAGREADYKAFKKNNPWYELGVNYNNTQTVRGKRPQRQLPYNPDSYPVPTISPHPQPLEPQQLPSSDDESSSSDDKPNTAQQKSTSSGSQQQIRQPQEKACPKKPPQQSRPESNPPAKALPMHGSVAHADRKVEPNQASANTAPAPLQSPPIPTKLISFKVDIKEDPNDANDPVPSKAKPN